MRPRIRLTKPFFFLMNNALRALLIVLFVCAGICHPALAASGPVTVPTGQGRVPTAADFGPHNVGGTGYSEAWSYQFFFDDGSEARFEMSRAKIGSIVGDVSGAYLALVGIGGENHDVRKQYQYADLRYDAGSGRLAIKESAVVDGALPAQHRIRFGAGKNGRNYELDLRFSDIVPGVVWGDGVFGIGDEQIGLFVHIPRARVEGTIAVDGVETVVKGTAFMDHSYQTDFAPKMARAAYRVVHHEKNGAEGGVFVVPQENEGGAVVGYGFETKGRTTRLLKPTELQVMSEAKVGGAPMPRQFVVRYEKGDPLIVNRDGQRHTSNALSELGGLQRRLARGFLGGEVVTVLATGRLNRGGALHLSLTAVK